uniref:Uncharacterized protein n=1 Tax=Populus trichocarpa TaxID=3694 RepID=A0A2K2BRR5_POPTR
MIVFNSNQQPQPTAKSRKQNPKPTSLALTKSQPTSLKHNLTSPHVRSVPQIKENNDHNQNQRKNLLNTIYT